MRVLVVDNYDSFVYNLVQYLGEVVTSDEWLAGVETATPDEIVVRRNDAVDLGAVDDIDPDAIVVSPGPGTPQDAGVSMDLFAKRSYPTMGVCLGHQALCAANGATVGHADEVVHGKPSTIAHDGAGIFAGLPATFEVGRYHSLAVERDALPDALVESAWTAEPHTADAGGDGSTPTPGPREAAVVMGVRHRTRPHVGVQFHPESILTDVGKRLVANFLTTATAAEQPP